MRSRGRSVRDSFLSRSPASPQHPPRPHIRGLLTEVRLDAPCALPGGGLWKPSTRGGRRPPWRRWSRGGAARVGIAGVGGGAPSRVDPLGTNQFSPFSTP